MATANDILNRAFRRIGILAGEEAMGAAEMVDALAAFNAMLHGFSTQGIYYTHVTLLAGDTVNVPDKHETNVMLMAVNELSQDYPAYPLAPAVMEAIGKAKTALQAYYFRSKPGMIDPILRSRRYGRFDISRGF